ncbi:GMC family oxidoreductase [Actinocrispum sp. NPDC049592]|uniref:GMC family oxidoreductase n=1 Tax=Actinocrispum sp. NPDC049592 TaxID=3154835 RepID=UPI003428DCB7
MVTERAIAAALGVSRSEARAVADRFARLTAGFPAVARLGIRALPVGLDLVKLPLLLAANPETTGDFQPGGRPDPPLTCIPSWEWRGARADVVIVGSGAGGAVVAKVLAEAGVDVVVVEEGRRHTAEDFRRTSTFDRFRELYRDSGATVALGLPPVVLPLGRGVGGTTLVNSGTCFRTPDTVLKRWQDDWGVPTEHFPSLLDSVEDMLQVRKQPENVLGGNGQRALKGALALGWEAQPLRRNAPGCAGSCQCAVGCPRNAKNGVHLNALPDACANGARIITEARVERIITARGRAEGVLIRRPDGTSFVLRADIVVAAAGATETPPLLRRSGLGQHPMLGKGMAVHPATSVAGRFPEKVNAAKGVLQSVGIERFHDEGILIEATASPAGLITFPLPLEEIPRRDHLAYLGAMIADAPSGEVHGRRRAIPAYRLTTQDAGKLRKAMIEMGRVLFAAGAEEVLTGLGKHPRARTTEHLEEIVRSTPAARLRVAAFHPTGTARMGADQQHAPVDVTGRLRGVQGVYIADASCIPTCPEVNPQLSIMAMAMSIADGITKAS